MPPDVEKKVNALVESGEFTTKTEVITRALRFYFDYKDTNIENRNRKIPHLRKRGVIHKNNH